MVASNYRKLRLVLWKNWMLQWRHKIQTAIELVMPILSILIIIMMRSLINIRVIDENTMYQPVAIDSLQDLRTNVSLFIQIDYRLVYSPKSPILDQLVASVVEDLSLNGHFGVASADLLETELIQSSILAGIEFDPNVNYADGLPSNLVYSLRFPGELRTGGPNPLVFNWQTGNSEPTGRRNGPRVRTSADGGVPPGYPREGFAIIQNAIAKHFLRIQSADTIQMPTIMLQRYPFPAFRQDNLLDILEMLMPILIVLSFIYPCINTVRAIATEKERQLKEAMKIMGLSSWLHWMGWFVRSLVYMTVSISFIVLLLKVPIIDGAAVFTNADWSVMWIFMLIYSVATITLCFAMSVYFSKANLAASVAGIVFFLFYLVFTFINIDEMPLWSLLVLSLLSNTGMAFGFVLIIRYEGTGEGVQWSNLFQPLSVDTSLSVGLVMVMMLAASFLYLIIALYVEQVYPGNYGVPKPWYFPVSRNFWCGVRDWHDDKITIPNEQQNDSFEDASNITERAGIQMRGLRKVFANNLIAVNPMTLDMYENQITVLLGHNGAGKTTTMSMLTGMLPPTSGTAYVNGFDITTNIDAVRTSIGLCPQHNILFEDLTVAEHIEFFATLKGMDVGEINGEIARYLKLIELEAKRDVLSKDLSGGMKRKLSVCLAFCGGSQVVFCDEPSSGMDPASRRALWDVIRQEKRNRTVLLSTHFMDEADVLADRIAIMSNGSLRCWGTPFFLKKRFGAGYHLICVKSENTNSEAIAALIHKHIPDATIEHDIRTELSFMLPENQTHLYEATFAELERLKVSLGLVSFGVSLTTMEEVFLNVGNEKNGSGGEDDVSDGRSSMSSLPSGSQNELIVNGSGLSSNMEAQTSVLDALDQPYFLSGARLVGTQTITLFKKRFIQTYRSWILLLAQLLIPALFTIISITTDRANRTSPNLPRLSIGINQFARTVSLLQQSQEVDNDSLQFRFAAEYERLTNIDNGPHWLEILNTSIEDHVLHRSEQNIGFFNRHYFVGTSMLSDTLVTAWFNNQPFHSIPLSLSLVHTSLIRAHLGSSFGLTVTNAPLPYNVETQKQQVAIAGQLGFVLAVNTAYAMAFVMAFFVLPYIREQANRAKLLQFVNGAKVYVYWCTAFVWDYMLFAVSCILLLVVFAIFQETGWSTGLELARIALVLAVFGFAALPFTYLMCRLYTSPTGGFTMVTVIYIFCGLLLPLAVTSLIAFDKQYIANPLNWIFMVLPHYSLSACLRKMQSMTQTEQMCETQCNRVPGCTPQLLCMVLPECCGSDFFAFEEPGISTPLVYMVAVGVLTIAANFIIEYGLLNSLFIYLRPIFSKQNLPPAPRQEDLDSDVWNEQLRVEAMSPDTIKSQSLVMKQLSKMYGSFLSVNRLSIGVDGAECFGLLGINGAGKTSTFKMLTGDLTITSGEAWVRGISLRTHINKVQSKIGYCPQFEALIEEMTCRQTLRMFCRLRGVPTDRITELIRSLATELNFVRHLDKQVSQCSGGNKRKLSTAVALIGNPVVVYLDEPTTGMDPGAKRHLWNMVNRIRSGGTTVVLTSHSMDECEALCTRLAIMVSGQFKCLGSVQHLKNKFSKGLTLVVKCTTTIELDAVKAFIGTNFGDANLQTDFHGMLTYHIPIGDQMQWSTMFGKMQLAKNKFTSIEDYTLSQTTLEQVFLAFAHQQMDTNNVSS